MTLMCWKCQQCQRECLPIRSESRCMCGHRLKEHQTTISCASGRRCTSVHCECKGFTYIVAEGAWILRCSCKHKHTDHHPNTHQCRKAGCKCTCFNSPWVCNCDHAWADHQQVQQVKPVVSFPGISDKDAALMTEIGGGLASEVNRWDLIKR